MLGLGIDIWQRSVGGFGSAGLSVLYKSLFCTSPTLTPSSGSGVAVFARSGTTATVTDWEGIVRPVKADEAKMPGLRRVENLIPAGAYDTEGKISGGFLGSGFGSLTNDVSYNNTTCTSFSITSGTTGSGNAYQLGLSQYVSVEAGDITSSLYISLGRTLATNEKISLRWKGVTWSSIVDISPGGAADDASAFHRLSVAETGLSAGSKWLTIWSSGTVLNSDITIYITKIQVEQTTGQGTNVPSEYVSVGVESSPYHGAGVDGVKYFANLQNNNTVTSNVVSEVAATAGSTTVRQGLLMEPASTNEIGYSTGFATGWNFTNCSIVGEDQAINGSQGFLFDNTLDTSSCLLFAVYDATNAAWITTETAYTVSTDYTRISHSFITPVGCTTVRVYPFRKAGGTVYAYRAFSVTASTDYTFSFYAKSKGTNDGEIYIDGVQVEPGSVLTSYIPATTGASVSRNADSLYYTGITFPQTAGFVLVNMEWSTGFDSNPGAGGIILGANNTGSNLLEYTTTAGQVETDDGTFQTTDTKTLTADEDVVYAVSWSGSSANIDNLFNGTWDTWAAGVYDGGYPTDGNDRVYLAPSAGLPILFKGILLSSTEKTTAEIESAYPTFACSEGP